MNAPTRDVALPGERTTALAAAFTDMIVYKSPLPEEETRSDSSGIRTRNPEVVTRMRYQLNHTRCAKTNSALFYCLRMHPYGNRVRARLPAHRAIAYKRSVFTSNELVEEIAAFKWPLALGATPKVAIRGGFFCFSQIRQPHTRDRDLKTKALVLSLRAEYTRFRES